MSPFHSIFPSLLDAMRIVILDNNQKEVMQVTITTLVEELGKDQAAIEFPVSSKCHMTCLVHQLVIEILFSVCLSDYMI